MVLQTTLRILYRSGWVSLANLDFSTGPPFSLAYDVWPSHCDPFFPGRYRGIGEDARAWKSKIRYSDRGEAVNDAARIINDNSREAHG